MSTSCLAAGAGLCLLGAGFSGTSFAADGGASGTGSPIEHLVVIFQENVSFDHYFATYPIALNPKGEPAFHAADDTPSVNGLGTLMNGQPEGVLLTHNPNASNPANGSNAINPFRLDRSQASTCDQDHAYGDEQKAFDQGLIDLFPASVGAGDRDFLRSHIRLGQGQGPRAGVFRRQHRYGPVELRAEFRDER
jgi:phospholipase C